MAIGDASFCQNRSLSVCNQPSTGSFCNSVTSFEFLLMDAPINLSGDEVEEEVGSASANRPEVPATASKKGKETSKLKPIFSGKPVKRQRKLTSTVWDDFEMIDELDVNGNMQCKCKRCGAKYIAESSHGTGNMLRHLKSCKGKNYRDIGQLILQSNLNGSLESKSPRFNQDEFRELVAIAIARHNLPLQLVEYEGIRSCFAYLNPEVKFFSRQTAKNDIRKMYLTEKSKLLDLLQSVPGRIALTSDCWTSLTTDGYISLTAHFVDKSWRLQKRILAFTCMPPPHTGAALAEKVCGLLKEWGIDKKIVSITLDNASNNDSMVDGLKFDLDLMSNGDYFHVRCCAHILNLIMQDGLKELDEAVLKVRECVKYCKGSQSRKQRFKHCVQHVGIESTRGLKQDVPTRWNSTFHMLDSALFYKKALLHLAKTDANFVHCPTSDEWMKIEKICKFLQVFHEVTVKFSGSNYPTSNLYFPNVFKIRLLLKEEMESSDRFLKNMANKMNLKFDKYWREFSTIMGIAAVFDPRYKFQVIDWAFKKIYGSSSNIELDLFKEKLFSLFDEYASLSATSMGYQSSSRAATNTMLDTDTYMTDFDEFSSCEFTTGDKSELQSYLEEPKLPRIDDFDVLEYWKPLQGRYPIVSQMARDILAIPISTVASESVFSIGGRVIDAYRSSLKPETVESLVWLRDWVFNEASMHPDEEELCNRLLTLKDDDDREDESNLSKSQSLQTQQFGLG